MLSISSLTYKVVAYQAVPNFIWDEAVDWALDMIELGFDTESLLILAGLTKPLNYFETVSYLNAAISELGLQFRSGDEGIISYSSFYVNQIAQSIRIRENLGKLSEFVPQVDYPSSIYDFYSLYWAWDDLDDVDMQWYYDGATLDNIEQLAVAKANQWMQDNELFYQQSLS